MVEGWGGGEEGFVQGKGWGRAEQGEAGRGGGREREEARKALTQQGQEKFTQWAPEEMPGGHQHLPGSQDGAGRCFWK